MWTSLPFFQSEWKPTPECFPPALFRGHQGYAARSLGERFDGQPTAVGTIASLSGSAIRTSSTLPFRRQFKELNMVRLSGQLVRWKGRIGYVLLRHPKMVDASMTRLIKFGKPNAL